MVLIIYPVLLLNTIGVVVMAFKERFLDKSAVYGSYIFTAVLMMFGFIPVWSASKYGGFIGGDAQWMLGYMLGIVALALLLPILQYKADAPKKQELHNDPPFPLGEAPNKAGSDQGSAGSKGE